MEKGEGYKGLILTLNSKNVGMTDEEAEKTVKRLLDALRRKAKREGWKYYIFIGFSRSNQKIKQIRPHFHIFLYADPVTKVSRWIDNYWNPPKKSKKRFGLVKREKIEKDKAGYFISGYIRGQSEFVREQQLGVE